MAVTSQQRERLKNALFYAQQNPDEAIEALLAVIQASSSSGPTVTIDNTLTKSGQVADAKATGDKITALEGRATFTQMTTQADSTATGTDVDTLKTDFNSLLGKLKTAGLMANS